MNHLHVALARLRGAGDALFALSVLALVLLMVTPLPPGCSTCCSPGTSRPPPPSWW